MNSESSHSEIFAPGLLEGRVALVTGGGTGLGKATALELSRCGAKVTITGRREEVLQGGGRGVLGADGAGGGDRRGRARARAGHAPDLLGARTRTGGFDLLVNNAGGQFFSPAELIASKGWQAVWRLNVEGMLNMSERAHELAFSGGRGGTIVNVTLSPHHGMPGMAHSGAARATVEALTRELAERWAQDGVTVSAVAAGVFETEVLAKYPEQVRAGMSSTVPLAAARHGRRARLAGDAARLPAGSGLQRLDDHPRRRPGQLVGRVAAPGLTDDTGAVPVEERKQR